MLQIAGMEHSAEIRWFIAGDSQENKIPDEILSWFSKGMSSDLETLKPELNRQDEYLLFPNSDTVGVKLREGKFEIKALAADARPLNLGNGINGRTDQWVKWSFGNEGLDALREPLHNAGHWVGVSKDRYLRKFSADSHTLVEVPTSERPMSGCNVELTCIEVKTKPYFWFSLGFEAFGSPASVVKILDCALQSFFGDHSDLPVQLQLNGRNSLSYPAWIATLE